MALVGPLKLNNFNEKIFWPDFQLTNLVGLTWQSSRPVCIKKPTSGTLQRLCRKLKSTYRFGK